MLLVPMQSWTYAWEQDLLSIRTSHFFIEGVLDVESYEIHCIGERPIILRGCLLLDTMKWKAF